MYSSALVTTPDAATAERIALELVESKLAACDNWFPVASAYRWKGRIERETEHFLILKTRARDFAAVSEVIAKVHPDEVPCIVRYDIADGFPPYLDWIRESTERRGEDSARR